MKITDTTTKPTQSSVGTKAPKDMNTLGYWLDAFLNQVSQKRKDNG